MIDNFSGVLARRSSHYGDYIILEIHVGKMLSSSLDDGHVRVVGRTMSQFRNCEKLSCTLYSLVIIKAAAYCSRRLQPGEL